MLLAGEITPYLLSQTGGDAFVRSTFHCKHGGQARSMTLRGAAGEPIARGISCALQDAAGLAWYYPFALQALDSACRPIVTNLRGDSVLGVRVEESGARAILMTAGLEMIADSLQQSALAQRILVWLGASQSVAVVEPAAGDVWSAGSKQHLGWVAPPGAMLRLECSIDGGTSAFIVADEIAGGDGGMSWTIPDATPSSTRCLIRAWVVGDTAHGESGLFSIDGNTGVREARAPLATRLLPVYPNPASELAIAPLALSSSVSSRLQLIDPRGTMLREIFLTPGEAGTVPIDLSGLAEGRYALRLVTALGSEARWLTVARR
jgi:hypothetical protein